MKEFIKKADVKNMNLEDVIFDIETTGFSSTDSQITMIGALYHDGSHFITRQILVESIDEEKKSIETFITISSGKRLISYNGLVFDQRYLKEKAEIYKLDTKTTFDNHFDLYKYIKANEKLIKIKAHGLKTMERMFKIKRPFDITGEESIAIYLDYIRKNKKRTMDNFVEYNRLDLINLEKLYELYEIFENLKTVAIEKEGKKINFFTIESISKLNSIYYLNLKAEKPLKNQISYKFDNCKFEYDGESILLMISSQNGYIDSINKGKVYTSKYAIKDKSGYKLKKGYLLIEDYSGYNLDNLKTLVKLVTYNMYTELKL